MKRLCTSLIILLTLTACSSLQLETLESTATVMPQVNIPNPASVYCLQNGNQLEIRTASDGSQSGVCVFPDGGTCDEWAYYREKCRPASQESPTPAIEVKVTSTASTSNTKENASGGYMPPGTSEEIADWWGVIESMEPGAQYDDCFERHDLGQIIYFGIDSTDPVVKSQIEALRDSGKIAHLYGTLVSNVTDYNGSQILVDHIEVEE